MYTHRVILHTKAAAPSTLKLNQPSAQCHIIFRDYFCCPEIQSLTSAFDTQSCLLRLSLWSRY